MLCPSSSCCNSSSKLEGVIIFEKMYLFLSDVFTMNNVVRGLNAQVTLQF